MAINSHVSDMVSTHFEEGIKSICVYDASDRLEFHYVANIDAEDGDLCMATQYTYVGTSTRVEKTKESKALWQSAWDI